MMGVTISKMKNKDGFINTAIFGVKSIGVMKVFKKKIRIENATSFKLEYHDREAELKFKEFKSYKSMEQFHNRQKDFLYLDCSRYAFVNDQWHRFIKVNSPFIFQSEMLSLSRTFNAIIEADIEAEILQNLTFED